MAYFQTKTVSVKRVSSSPYQAKTTEALRMMVNFKKISDSISKYLSSSEILKSNEIVLSIINCLKTQFIKPFNEEFDKRKLYKLVSGKSVTDKITDGIY